MGFSLNSPTPANLIADSYYTSKKKVYPDGSWTCTHATDKFFLDKNDIRFLIATQKIGYLTDNGFVILTFDNYENFGFIDYNRCIFLSDLDYCPPPPKEGEDDNQVNKSESKEKRVQKHDKVDVEHAQRRAKSKIFDICMCNDWTWFFTGTFNTNELRTDPKKTLAKMRTWLNNQVTRKGLKYVLVAEYTPINGYIHFHGLFNNAAFTYDFNDMYKVDGIKKPVKLKTLQNRHIFPEDCHKVYNIADWKFGWCTAIECYGNKVSLARYITKYLTKENEKIFGKYYWSSKNIVREPMTVYFNVSEDEFWDDLPPDTFYIPMCSEPFKYDCSFHVRGNTVETEGN